MTGFRVEPESINGNAHVLVEVAGLLVLAALRLAHLDGAYPHY